MRIATITTENGYTWKTSINGTIPEIFNYFYGQRFNTLPFPGEAMSEAVKVEVTGSTENVHKESPNGQWTELGFTIRHVKTAADGHRGPFGMRYIDRPSGKVYVYGLTHEEELKAIAEYKNTTGKAS